MESYYLSLVSAQPLPQAVYFVIGVESGSPKWVWGTDVEYLYGDEQRHVTAITTIPSSEQNSENTRSQFTRNRMNNSKHFRDGC
ncbi:hypothetical protein AVEN_254313-1 [Araneus ventricosus]|uniref:Uncharacterized protein n=1 Tax=Araneus ventricosus TaxID=182803 RepID=A0A4Y2NIZ2_ARAVE|nr:hypothetical protein AVEN_254313-1 [Araneus ventricosus]